LPGHRGVRRLLSAALVAAALLFVGIAIARNADQLRAFEWRPDLPLLLISIPLHTLVLAWGVWVWGRVLVRFEGGHASLPQLQRIWFLSGVARYIPGKVWQFVAVADLAERAGLSRVLLLTSMIIQMAFTLLAAALLAAATLPLPLIGIDVGPAIATAVAALIALLLVHPALLNAVLRLVPRTMHRDVLTWRGGWMDGIALLAMSVLSWLFYGAAFHLFVASLTPVPLDALPTLAGVNALAFAAGYLAVLAPAGLGVREGAMTVLLSPLLPLGVAAVVSALARLWTIGAELLGALLFVRWRGTPVARTGADGEDPGQP